MILKLRNCSTFWILENRNIWLIMTASQICGIWLIHFMKKSFDMFCQCYYEYYLSVYQQWRHCIYINCLYTYIN